MVKRIIVIGVLVAAGLWLGLPLARRWLGGEEGIVRQRLLELANQVSFPAEEKLVGAALRSERLKSFLAPTCRIEIGTYGFNTEYTAAELASHFLSARSLLQSLSVGFHDLQVEPIVGDTASAAFTVRATAVSTAGERDSRTAAVHCQARKIDGQWVFAEFVEHQVLER